MAHDNAKLTRAANEISIGELTLSCRPLTDRDLSDLDNWVQEQYLKTAFNAAKNLEPALRKRAEEIALSKVSGLSFLSQEGFKMMQTRDGMSKILYQMSDKEMSLQEVRSQITFENLKEAIAKGKETFVKQNLGYTEDEDVKDDGKKSQKKSTPKQSKKST